jgi:hypothetical protein
MIWCRGTENWDWITMPRLPQNPQKTNTLSGRQIKVLTEAPLRIIDGALFSLPIGYLISDGAVTSILTSNVSEFKIYKIIGVY